MNARLIENGLYFIGIIPPPNIYSEIQLLKETIHKKYNSKASLNSPPHITLHMPFDWKLRKEELLTEKLCLFSKSIHVVDIHLKDFNCFEPRVIYLDVTENEPLKNMQQKLFSYCKKELNLFNAQYKEMPFHPHITLAFRDLKKPMFYKAWQEFKTTSYQATFTLKHLVLLKHNGKKWDVFNEFEITG
jgi:2'-5' RNA ligase